MKYAIGIDLGGTNTKIGLVNSAGKIVARESFGTQGFRGQEPLLGEMAAVIRRLLDGSGIKSADFCGIGIGVPGIVDSENGIIYNLTNISGWRNVRVTEKLRKLLAARVFLDNDVNLMALGELHFGAARGAANVICVTLGTGVGGGIIIEKKLYRGSSLSAGEIGHVVIDPEGPECGCGNRGCLEAYVGNQRIVDRVVADIKRGQKTSIGKLAGGDLSQVTPEVISKAAAQKDRYAVSVWQDVGRYIGIVFAGLTNVLNPDRIVVGGGVAKAGPVLFGSIEKTVGELAFPVAAKKAKIVGAALGNDAGMIGAATVAMVGR
ncbi:MAG TPA: ROK family protein [bacterium]|nr:ROK family protein [bacterium]